MSLLRKIQDATVDPDFQLADVLRMCQILAARLKHTAFQDWIKQELNGYEEDPGKLPDYRVLNNLSCRGNFIGPWGSSYKNAPIPLLSLPEEFREAASTKYIFQSVSALESIVNRANQKQTDITRACWEPDIVALLGSDIPLLSLSDFSD